MPMSIPGLIVSAIALLPLLSLSVAAKPPRVVSWAELQDAGAQVYEDPYRDLTAAQMRKLMALASAQHSLQSDELIDAEIEELQHRVQRFDEELASEGLDAQWILSQREAVAARRQRAAVATNSQLEAIHVELYGHFLHSTSLDTGESVAYLIPDRGFCMHLPAPPPNQVIRVHVESLPDPVGPCIAAAVRGRLSVEEARHTLSSADGPTLLWSRWKMDVHEITTNGSLSSQAAAKD